MPELVSLLDAIRENGLEASLITTFSAYFPFYEDVVLRRLLANGCRHNTVLVDASQLAASLVDRGLRPTSAGYDYTIAPIPSNAAFHPKLLLLVGPKRAVTCVGSHNLTLSGFGLNREATCKVAWNGTADGRGAQVARAAWRAAQSWLDTRGGAIPQQARQNILAIEEIAPWLRGKVSEDRQCRLLHQSLGTPSLWQQVAGLVTHTVKRITVVGAFFDARCNFIRELESTYPKAKVRIAVEPATVQLAKAGAGRVKGTWHDASEMTGRTGYLHAKLVYFDTNGRADLLCVGSANPSAPAWGVGGSERNEELEIAWSGSAASEFARELGLHDVGDLPKISAKTLKEIDAASSARKDEAETNNGICGIALINEDGIEIPADTFPRNAKCLDLLDDQDHVLCAEIKFSSNSKTVRAPLPRDLADRARILRITTTRGPPLLLLCHHMERRTAAARTGRQAQLRKALSSLEGDPSSLANLIAAVQHVIFAVDVGTTAPTKSEPAGGSRPTSPETSITTLEGDEKDSGSKRLRPRLASGDLGYLLQVLIYELGKSLPAPTGTAVRNEEEAIDSDDETPTPPPQSAHVNDRELAEACGQRVGTLVNRMVRVLDETAKSEGIALTAVAQLTAVLCTLRALRQLDRQERWRQVGVSLVPEDCRSKLLDGILNTVIGGTRPLMRRPEVAAADHSMEVGHLRGLMIWLAWECKFRADHKISLGDEIEARDENIRQRAALLELVVPAVPDTDAFTEAERSVESTATARQTLSAREWLQTHLVWGRRVQQNAKIRSDYAPGDTGSLARGTIVALPSVTGRTLHVLAGYWGTNVVVFDFTVASHERQFLRTKVISIAPP
jgi:hypothetical protein